MTEAMTPPRLPPRQSPFRTRNFGAGVLLTTLFLAYPANWVRIFAPGAVRFPGSLALFTLPALALVAAGVILLSPGRLALLWRRDRLSRGTLICFAAAAAVQSVLAWLQNWNLEQWLTTFFYFLWPLAGVVYSAELRKLLPGFLALTAAGCLALLVVERAAGQLIPVGPTGNWNWNQTLLWIAVPSALALLPVKKRALSTAALSVLILAGAALLFPGCWSRGTCLAAVGGAILMMILSLPNRALRRSLGIVAVALAAAGFCALLECSAWDAARFPAAETLTRDTRIQLWRGGVRMAAAVWPTGVGAARTEFELPRHLPAEYYLSLYGSDRSPHCHNELLFQIGAFGLAGTLGAVGFWLSAARGIRRAARRTLRDRLLGWGFLTLLLHGMGDVLLAEPLTGGLALLLGGCFWGFRLPESRPVPGGAARAGAGAALLAAAAGLALLTFAAGFRLHNAQFERANGRIDAAEAELLRSIELRPRAESLAFAGRMALFDRKDPRTALRFLNALSEHGIPHYSHAAQWTGRAYAAAGAPDDALRAFAREDEFFPLGALTAGLRLMVLTQSNAAPELRHRAELDYRARMQLKGMRPEQFPLLLRHPEIDDNTAERLRLLEREARP